MPTRVQHRVDGEPDGLQGREQHLRAGAGEEGCVTQPSEREHRLKGPAVIPVDGEGALVLFDRTVTTAPQHRLQRLIHDRLPCLLVGVDREGLGAPLLVEVGLTNAAGGSAAQQPLQLDGVRTPQPDHTREALKRTLLAACQLR